MKERFAWTLVHIVNSEEDELVQALHGRERFLLTASVGATDTLLDSPTQASIRYDRQDVLVDHEFVDIISEANGIVHVDLTRLSETAAIAR